ncbi:MAG TPA: putative glycoside hydrolase [Candidatus Eisenbacteria bacterium]|nr:putative glycoside hydrolase [Candidatus Eisenbacteria bacterium]
MNRPLAQRIASIATASAVMLSVFVSQAGAAIKTPEDRFVRTANYYLRAGTDIPASDYPALAKFDLLVFPAEAQVYNRDMFAALRKLNPNILILAYVPSKSWNYAWVDPLHQKLFAGIQESWWLLDPNGNKVSVWGNSAVISGISPWNTYLPQFVHDQIMSTGYWDGVFYDEFSSTASWMNGGNIDIHRDGIKDDPALLDAAWERGMLNMLKNTRDSLGPDAVIITNGDSTESLQQYVNGRMFESFPTPWEAGGTWSGVMANYVRLHKVVGHTPVFIINTTTNNTGNNADYKKVRYGLTSTLLADGFFSFDFGDSNHGQLWRYDEEDVRLGRPLGDAVNLSSPTDRRIQPSVWRRDFANGAVLVNSSTQTKTVTLGGELEKVRGTQDPAVNDGSVVTAVTIQPNDGVVLLKRIEKVEGATFPNGAFVRLFSADGAKLRNGFFSYDGGQTGAASITIKDLDGDGSTEKVVASKGSVSVYDAKGGLKSTFRPFGDAYTLDVNIAIGDLNGDGKAEIVTGAGPGGGPQIRVYSYDGKLLTGFFAYDSRFRGGVNVAVGDLYGTGRSVIVAGAGAGGGPHVRVFTMGGRALSPGFFAYDYRFRGGVNVAVGDLDGDGKAEIVTGAGPGGGPHVRIFNRYGSAQGKGFFAADPLSRTGVRVAVTDTNADGKAEIATMTTDVFQFAAVP